MAEQLNVIIIDDNPLFALQVWRRLSGELVTTLPGEKDIRGLFWRISDSAESAEPISMNCLLGRSAFWWVSADSSWMASLAGVVGKIIQQREFESSGVLAIVDFRGPSGNLGETLQDREAV